jgi:hypothetical protein
VLTDVWGISSRFVQVTVAPTGTVIVWGPKLKLSIFTSVPGAEGLSLALTMVNPASSNTIAIAAVALRIAAHTFLFFIVVFLFRFDVVIEFLFLAACKRRICG